MTLEIQRNKTLIYSLNCPITDEVRYIGKTSISPKKRFNNHLKSREKSKKAIWIKELLSKNLLPVFKEIEYCDNNEWVEKEIFYIKKHSNLLLLNENKGGGGSSINTNKFNHLVVFKLKLEKENYSKNSVKNYMSYVSKFLKESNSVEPKKIHGRYIEIYINNIKNNNTRNSYITSLKLFYKLIYNQPKKITYIKYEYS
jgi:hypothetical protein